MKDHASHAPASSRSSDGVSPERRRRRFVLALFLIALTLLAVVVAPFAGAFFTAALLGAVLHPLQVRLTRRLGGRKQLAAALLTFATILVVVLPLGGVTFVVVAKGIDAVESVSNTLEREGFDGLIEPLPEAVQGPARRFVGLIPPTFFDALGLERPLDERARAGDPLDSGARDAGTRDAGTQDAGTQDAGTQDAGAESPDPSAAASMSAINSTASAARGAVKRVFDLFLRTGLLIVALYFALVDGHRLIDYVVDMVPLAPSRTRSLLSQARSIGVGILVSLLATAVAQTLVAMVGYLIARAPSFWLLSAATFVFAFVPAIGGASVPLATGLYLWISGHTLAGVFLVVWALLAVGLTDNIVKPLVARGHTPLPASLLFFAMVCGLVVFGPMGLVAGPLVVALFRVSAQMLRDDARERPSADGPTAAPSA